VEPIDVSVVRDDGVFEIIDLDAHPDRLKMLRTGRFEEARLAQAETTPIDAPLLLYWRQNGSQVLFVPSGGTEQDEADRDRLTYLLLKRLREENAPEGRLSLAIPLSPYLPVFIAEDDAIRAVAPALQSFFLAEDTKTAIEVVQEAPQLLQDGAEKALDLLKVAKPGGVDPP
jgi:hypothetical protein